MRARILAAVVAIATCSSFGQGIEYVFEGQISDGTPTQGPFAGFDVGDMFRATVEFDPSNPVFDEPGSRSWGDDSIVSYTLEIDGQVLDLMTLNGSPSFRGAEVEDDSPVEGDDHDFFSLYVSVPVVGVINARFETFGPSGLAIGSLSGTEPPTQEELQPARWQSALMVMGTGRANRLVGTIEQVSVIPTPASALVMGAAGALMLRRRR